MIERWSIAPWVGIAAVGLCIAATTPRTQLPRFWFKENSTKIFSDSAFYGRMGEGAEPQTLMNWVASVLQDNPTTVLELRGHSDQNERNGLDLSRRRALTIRDSLVHRGFPEGRLAIAALGSTEPLIDSLTISRMTTEVERDVARQENRRVDLKIIAWDWKP